MSGSQDRNAFLTRHKIAFYSNRAFDVSERRERFDGVRSVSIKPRSEVPGFLRDGKLVVPGNAIDGIPLALYDRVQLSLQSEPSQNGSYVVSSIGASSTTLLATFAFDPSRVTTTSASSARVVSVDGKTLEGVPVANLRPGDRIALGERVRGFVSTVDGSSVEVRDMYDKSEGPVDGIATSQERCIGDEAETIRAACESELDYLGRPKTRVSVWDRPCRTDDECSFFQKNVLYPNRRGGCEAGYCEFPIGVRRLSYRRHDTASSPWCHGCGALGGAGPCCSVQGNRPDYAFELDEVERVDAGL
jgi:hypothetical protein